MAQGWFGQSDLKKTLLRVPRSAVGMRNVADLFTLRNLIPCFSHCKNVQGDFAQRIYEKTLRLLMKYFNTHPPFQFDEALVSGSWSEGLTMHQVLFDTPEISDIDFMCILKNISFSEEDQACGNLAVREDTPFVNAYITTAELLKMWEDFLEDPSTDKSKRQLSAWKLKAMLHENYKKMGEFLEGASEKCKTIGDGPSLELKRELPKFNPEDPFQYASDIIWYKIIASSDIILTIRCDGWPRCAWEWLSRDRRWPDKNLVQKISQDGFHIVPKSSPDGNFRLSFSNAETTLIENLTHLQHKVIRAFKAVIKYHQSKWSPNIKDIICTYYLKTIAFWHIEKTTQDSWTEDNAVSHLLSLIEEFAQALRKGNLPMYFLPQYNLLQNVENCEEMKKISDKVVELSKDIPAITTAISRVANTILAIAAYSAIPLCVMQNYTSVRMYRKGITRDKEEDRVELGNRPQMKDKPFVQNGPSWIDFLDILYERSVLNTLDPEIFQKIMEVRENYAIMLNEHANRSFEIMAFVKEAILDNINDNLFYCSKEFKTENETFISLD